MRRRGEGWERKGSEGGSREKRGRRGREEEETKERMFLRNSRAALCLNEFSLPIFFSPQPAAPPAHLAETSPSRSQENKPVASSPVSCSLWFQPSMLASPFWTMVPVRGYRCSVGETIDGRCPETSLSSASSALPGTYSL